MADKKATGGKVKCDSVKDTARLLLCAIVASDENENGADTIAKAYDLARAFEAYEN